MRAFFVLALLAGLFVVAPAGAANMPNASCSTLGETRMSDNQNDLIACLCPPGTSGVNCSGKKWKAMSSTETSSSPPGTLCGMSFSYNCDNMMTQCAPEVSFPCQGHNVSTSCPSGYTLRGASTGGGTYAGYFYSCMKN